MIEFLKWVAMWIVTMVDQYGMPEAWDAKSVYCNLCCHDWVAVFDVNNTTRLECPECHGMTRINEIREA